MIGYLHGEVMEAHDGVVILLCGRVGYEVFVPWGEGCAPPAIGEERRYHVTTLVRQDAIQLCGFPTLLEKQIFARLLDIQGIGPRLALAVLGTLGTAGLVAAAKGGNARAIQAVPGVGKKTAERIVLELGDRVANLEITGESPLPHPGTGVLEQALKALGFRKAEIDDALRVVVPRDDEPEAELVRRALRHLRGGKTP